MGETPSGEEFQKTINPQSFGFSNQTKGCPKNIFYKPSKNLLFQNDQTEEQKVTKEFETPEGMTMKPHRQSLEEKMARAALKQ